MRAAFLIAIAISSLSLALPIHQSSRGLLATASPNDAAKPMNASAMETSLPGAAPPPASPALDKGRAEVVQGLNDTASALQKVSAQAGATNNAGVSNLVTQAQSALATAEGGVSNIGAAIAAGTKPATADQKTVVQGIIGTETAVKGMKAAISTPDAKLSRDIAKAVKGVKLLRNGALDVLKASNLTLADLGLPDNTVL